MSQPLFVLMSYFEIFSGPADCTERIGCVGGKSINSWQILIIFQNENENKQNLQNFIYFPKLSTSTFLWNVGKEGDKKTGAAGRTWGACLVNGLNPIYPVCRTWHGYLYLNEPCYYHYYHLGVPYYNCYYQGRIWG